MNFHDPLRPKYAQHWQALCTPSGAPVAKLPELMFDPQVVVDGVVWWRVRVFVPLSGGNSYVERKVECTVEEVRELLSSYYANPEGVLRDRFGYIPREPQAVRTEVRGQTPRTGTTLEQLGLL